MDRRNDARPPEPAPSGSAGDGARQAVLPAGRPPSPRRREPRENPFDGVRRGSADYCRQARRLRAHYASQPVLLHEQLSQLKVQDPPQAAPVHTARAIAVRIDRLDEAWEEWEVGPGAVYDRSTTGARDFEPEGSNLPVNTPDEGSWTGAIAEKVGTSGVSVLSRLRDRWTVAPGAMTGLGTRSRSGSFADYASEQITGPVLAYTDRLALLREAGRRGIGRFEANLVIAAVQHRLGNTPRTRSASPKVRGLVRTLALFAIAQSVILLGLWQLFHG